MNEPNFRKIMNRSRKACVAFHPKGGSDDSLHCMIQRFSLEEWYQIASIVGSVASVVGFVVLCIYARDTNHIKKASMRQAENATLPCVLVVANPDLPPGPL